MYVCEYTYTVYEKIWKITLTPNPIYIFFYFKQSTDKWKLTQTLITAKTPPDALWLTATKNQSQDTCVSLSHNAGDGLSFGSVCAREDFEEIRRGLHSNLFHIYLTWL